MYKLQRKNIISSRRHIYLSPRIARLYKKVKDLSENKIEEGLLSFIQENVIPLYERHKNIKIFEGGIGPGTFTFPFARVLTNLGVNSVEIYGIDNSNPMLQIFNEELKKSKFFNKNIIASGYGDLEYTLPYKDEEFHIVLLAGVLHCVKDWKKVLINVKRVLMQNGILIIAFRCDEWIKLLSGEILLSYKRVPKQVVKFWYYYYHLRKNLNIPIDGRVKFLYETSKVEKELNKLGFKNMKSYKITWKWEYTFKDFLFFIKEGVWSALGSGISQRNRKILYNHMKRWLQEQNINLEQKINVDIIFDLRNWIKGD